MRAATPKIVMGGSSDRLKNRSFRERLGSAIAGLREAWRRERSFRTQIAIAAALALGLVVLRPSAVWIAIAALAVALVLSAELLNSALELLIDHLDPAVHDRIRVIKDMAAGAVLVACLGALLVGLLLLATSVGR